MSDEAEPQASLALHSPSPSGLPSSCLSPPSTPISLKLSSDQVSLWCQNHAWLPITHGPHSLLVHQSSSRPYPTLPRTLPALPALHHLPDLPLPLYIHPTWLNPKC